ncbi:MAG: hypothetical protein B6244_10250 [Candidatus Cloacimonetes bacterium 4572_55]|nr:MAG: hypothetical protein B6244_10250 [Candidatus Cloacimonetes bacterium 4572_55]
MILIISSIPFVHNAFAINDIPDVEPGERAPIDSTFHESLSLGLEYVFSEQYERAVALFDSLQKVFPDHPAPYFYMAATYQSWMSSYRFSKFQPELEENVQSAIDIGDRLMENNDDPWLNFYVGAAYGYRGFYRFRKHNWIGAYLDGKKGVGNFEKALDKVPNIYDCYLGMGSYHYWRTAKSKFIKVVAFWMKDRREMGLEQIRFSIDHGRYTSEEASYGLIIAYYDFGWYDKAFELNEIAIGFCDPPTLPALFMRGRLSAHSGRWDKAKSTFEQILNRIENYKYQSVGYQVECKYWIAEALKAEGENQKALKMAQNALEQSLQRDKKVELENPVDNFDEIKKRLTKLHESLK